MNASHCLIFILFYCFCQRIASLFCPIKVQVCVSSSNFGFIEIKHARLATWKCSEFSDTTYHTAFVTSSCQYMRLMKTIKDNDALELRKSLYDRYQKVPFGGFFIWVTSRDGFKSFMDEVLADARHQYHAEFLQSLGIFVYKPKLIYVPRHNDFYNNLLSSNEPSAATYRNYSECLDIERGINYRGTTSQTHAGVPCAQWTHSSNPYNPHYYTELEENYCRQIGNIDNLVRDGIIRDRQLFCLDSVSETLVRCDVDYCDQTNDGLVVISRRTVFDLMRPFHLMLREEIPLHRHDTITKVVSGSMGKRVVEHYFDADPNSCTEPLQALDQRMLDPRQHLQDDRSERDVQVGNRKMHLVASEPIGCHGDVYGWQFIPANPGVVYFTVMTSDVPELVHKGSSSINITDSMITDDLEIQYLCTRSSRIKHVMPGDIYGFYTQDHEESTLAPLKRVFPMEYDNNIMTQEFHPLLYHDAGQVDVHDLDATDIIDSAIYLSQLPTSHVMSLALKPIFHKDFVYTCGCREHLSCHIYGDKNMECREYKCQCKTNYVFNSKFNLCVYTMGALHHPAWVQGHDGNATAAVDGDLSTYATFAIVETDYFSLEHNSHWWVVDLGYVTNVFAISIAGAPLHDRYLEMWSALSDYEAGHRPDAWIYDSITEDLPTSKGLSQVQVIVTHGPFAWRIYNSDYSSSHLINSELLGGTNVFTSDTPGFGPVNQNIAHVSRVQAGYFMNSDEQCLGSDLSFHSALGDQCLMLYCNLKGSAVNQNIVISDSESNWMRLNANSVALGDSLSLIAVHLDADPAASGSRQSSLGTSQYISFSVEAKCITDQGGSLQVVDCSAANQISFMNSVPEPVAKHTEKMYETPANGDALQPNSITPSSLVDIFRQPIASSGEGDEVGVGSISVSPAENEMLARTSNLDLVNTPTNILYRGHEGDRKEEGMYNFKLGVSLHFDGETMRGEAEDFDLCAFVGGYLPPNKRVLIDCHKPLKGRYVAYFSVLQPESYGILRLSEVAVHTLPGCLSGQNPEDCLVVNVCDEILHNCEHACVETNEGAGFRCECPEGFRMNPDGQTCSSDFFSNFQGFSSMWQGSLSAFGQSSAGQAAQDGTESGSSVDQVALNGTQPQLNASTLPLPQSGDSGLLFAPANVCPYNTLGCDHLCVITATGSECMCRPGYRLLIDGASCRDVNECTLRNGGCSDKCQNVPGSYRCSCYQGFQLSNDQHLCVDLNECSMDQDLCDHICINTPGSFRCQCDVGYSLLQNGECISLNSVKIELELHIPFIEEYADVDSEEYEQLASNLSASLEVLCQRIETMPISCTVRDPMSQHNTTGNVMFHLVMAAKDPIRDEDVGPLSMQLKQALGDMGNQLVVFGKPVNTSNQLMFLQGSFNRWPITSMCSFWDTKNHCKNYGVCMVKDGKPTCSCAPGYYGARCTFALKIPGVSPSTVVYFAIAQKVSLSGVIAGFLALTLLAAAIFVMFITLLCRKKLPE